MPVCVKPESLRNISVAQNFQPLTGCLIMIDTGTAYDPRWSDQNKTYIYPPAVSSFSIASPVPIVSRRLFAVLAGVGLSKVSFTSQRCACAWLLWVKGNVVQQSVRRRQWELTVM